MAPETSSAAPRRFGIAPERVPLLVGLGVFAFALLFELYTRHAWEDWYITFRPAKNLALGHGLVYNPGERVHTFTSVIGTLLPALLSFLTFNVSDDLTLWLFRVACAAALGAAAALLAKASRLWFAGLAPAVLLVGGAATDAKTVDFSINGMETPFTLLGLSLFLYFVTTLPKAKLGIRLGVVWALLQYARPDGFLYVLPLMAGMVLFLEGRKETLRVLAVSGLVGAVLFAPWFLFATGYYGSAIPHSLMAKQVWMERNGLDFYLDRAAAVLRSLFLLRAGPFDAVFSPPYAPTFGMLPAALVFSRVLGVVAAVVWVFRGVGAPGRMASLAYLGYLFYLGLFAPILYPWYLPGATWLALVSLAFGLDALCRLFGERRHFLRYVKSGAAFVAVILLVAGLALTAVSAEQFRFAQRVIEDGHRRRIGEWIQSQAVSPRETVFLECAGYVGFFSGLKLYDYPGMTAPETVAARRESGREDFLVLVKRLRPDWLVLRPVNGELAGMWQSDSAFLKQNYRVVKTFDVNSSIDAIRFKPFEPYFRHDARFVVARRIP